MLFYLTFNIILIRNYITNMNFIILSLRIIMGLISLSELFYFSNLEIVYGSSTILVIVLLKLCTKVKAYEYCSNKE